MSINIVRRVTSVTDLFLFSLGIERNVLHKSKADRCPHPMEEGGRQDAAHNPVAVLEPRAKLMDFISFAWRVIA